MDVDGLVVHEGDEAVATGRLVRTDLGDWFEPAFPIAEPSGVERRVRPVWNGAVRVAGADFDAVPGRFEKGGAVEGWATVTGTWSGGQLRAERQTTPVPEPAAPARWVTPPCPPPASGWPVTQRRGDIELSYDLGELAGTGAAVAVTVFHPGQNQAVLVVAAADIDAMEAKLRPQLGESLCVVPSRWTTDQLDGVRDYLHRRWQSWDLYQLGPQHGEDGQARIAARLVRVLPEIADWAGSLPSGIVALEPWLTPARGDRGATCLAIGKQTPGPSPQVTYPELTEPPFGAAVCSKPITARAVRIWTFCVPGSLSRTDPGGAFQRLRLVRGDAVCSLPSSVVRAFRNRTSSGMLCTALPP